MADELQPVGEELIERVRAQTPARILVGRAGPAYLTSTWLGLREDHAAALDAVHAELALPAEFVTKFNLFEVSTQAVSKQQYLLRPDLGRRLDAGGRAILTAKCKASADVQIVIGDGLSAAAVHAQTPALLPLLFQELAGLTLGQPFAVRFARVGVMNDIGDLLTPTVVVLLIGERPGLATAESLSAYLAYKPNASQTDANRNLISNIHARGVSVEDAARRVSALCRRMISHKSSGFALKEEPLPPRINDVNA
jgi:ethanolamine ammonia-lyase small subunit